MDTSRAVASVSTVITLREVGEAVEHTVLESLGRMAARVQESRSLRADVLESDDAYLVVFDAPDVEAQDVEVEYEDEMVEVHVERFREFREGYEMRAPGRGLSLHGRAGLPDDATVDAAGATATLRGDGTLHVELPKRGRDSESTEEESAADEHTGGVDTGSGDGNSVADEA